MAQAPAEKIDLEARILARVRGLVEDAILVSRYLLVLMYGGLLYKIIDIMFVFSRVLVGMNEKESLTENALKSLELLDITMVANLVWLISAGSYYVFIDNHYPGTSGKKRPRSLAHVSSGLLKEKMAGSLIGVSSVHLLKIFLHLSTSPEVVEWSKMGALLAIHFIFIVGLLAFNYSNAADHHIHPEEKASNAEKDS